jgi:hypothetical protein
LIIVYGPAHHDKSVKFIAQLFRKCLFPTLPVVMGGDFNFVRLICDKNNGNINQCLMDMFIDLHQLQEIRRNGPRYT